MTRVGRPNDPLIKVFGSWFKLNDATKIRPIEPISNKETAAVTEAAEEVDEENLVKEAEGYTLFLSKRTNTGYAGVSRNVARQGVV